MFPINVEQALQTALAHHQGGRFAEAEALYWEILDRKPQYADALHLLGLIALATGRVGQAPDLIRRALAISPAQPLYLSNLGEAYRRLGRLDEAVASLRQALVLQPDLPMAHLNLGVALLDARRDEEALASIQRALDLQPNDPVAHNSLGRALSAMRRHDEATACYQRALALQPDYADAVNNLAGSFVQTNAYDEAIAAARRALALCPDHAEAHTTLGAAHWRKGEFDAALQCCQRAIACQPGLASAHGNLGALLLMTGRYEQGWREYEWRADSSFSCIPRRHFTARRWDGRPVPGARLLLHAEQGVGDAIQFLRYVPLAIERAGAAHVILECPPSMTRLITQSGEWGAEIVARQSWDGAALPAFDLHLPLPSLPLALGVFEPLTMPRPYLHAPAEARRACRELLAPGGFRVGLVWAGNPRHLDDRHRSIAFDRLRPLLRVPEVNFYSLQIEPGTPMGEGVSDLAPHLTDFADTAAFLSELDLVITVDTAVAHLAGALGRPVWTLLPFVPDWRWGLDREDTPWYPTMRLFRQKTAGDWDEVMERVADDLSRAVADGSVGSPQSPC